MADLYHLTVESSWWSGARFAAAAYNLQWRGAMRRARAQEIGRGLGVIAFFLMFTVICMSSQRRASAAIALLFFGWLTFGCAACGAMQMPLRELPIGAWRGMFLGLGLMALGALWCFIYESPWADA